MDALLKKELRIFHFFPLIIDTLNQSLSLVQYERFKRERLYYITTGRKLKYQSEIEDKEEKSRRRLFDDLRWTLEYHQNGLMSLLIYLVHIIILVTLAAQALVYLSFPTERDPKTGLFINKYLCFVEDWLFIDSTILFDPSGLLNRVILLVLLRFLTLRIRAFYIKMQRAKKNRYGYKSINIVDINLCYGLAFHNQLKGLFRQLYESLTHDCSSGKELSDYNRRATLEFNKRVRKLDKIDRIYFYNQISFNKCYHKLNLLEKYHRNIKSIDAELAREPILNPKRVGGSGAVFEDTNKQKVSLLENVFSVELPNRIGYLQSPEHSIDLKTGAVMASLYVAAMVLSGWAIMLSAISFILGISQISKSVVRIQPFLLTQIIKGVLSTLCVAIGGCDNFQLAYTSLVANSRSQKIIELIKRENDIYRSHARRFVSIYDEHRINHAAEQAIDSDSADDDSDSDIEINSNESNEYCALLQAYKRRLPRVQIKELNENLNYILDLIEVILVELEDRKKLFTTHLDVNLVFEVVELSVALALISSSDNVLGLRRAYSYAFIDASCLLACLFTGAVIELAFSRIYRSLSPFLVNEFSLVDRSVHSRMFKICERLVLVENRSYVILGNFPLTVGSLPSILGWVATITILFQRLII